MFILIQGTKDVSDKEKRKRKKQASRHEPESILSSFEKKDNSETVSSRIFALSVVTCIKKVADIFGMFLKGTADFIQVPRYKQGEIIGIYAFLGCVNKCI